MSKPKQVTVRNSGTRTHIFGPVGLHIVNPKSGKEEFKTVHQLVQLIPGQTVPMTPEQFAYYDDEILQRKVDTRELAICVDGRDLRPALLKKEEADRMRARGPALPTEAEDIASASVLAEILADGEPQES